MDLTRRLLWLALVLVMPCSMLAAPGVGIGPETLYTQTLKTNSTKAGWQKALSISTNITDIGTNVSFQGNANISGSYLSFRDTNVITTGVSASLSPAIFLTNALANSFAFGLKDINGNTFEMRIDAAGNSGTFYHPGAIFLSGGGKTVDVAAGGFAPGTDADTDLGGPTFRWKDIYSTGTLTAGSMNATTNLSGSSATLGSMVITNGVTSNGATNTGIWDMPATALQTMAPGSLVAVSGYAHRVVGSNAVATVLTSTPEVATNNINDGTQIVILGTSDTATVTLNDSRTTAGAGSALLMRSPIMALYNGGVIGFRYSTNINRWKELFRSENGSQVSEFANAKVYTNLALGSLTVATLPVAPVAGSVAYCSDVVTPNGTGSLVYYNTQWNTLPYNIPVSSDIYTFMLNSLRSQWSGDGAITTARFKDALTGGSGVDQAGTPLSSGAASAVTFGAVANRTYNTYSTGTAATGYAGTCGDKYIGSANEWVLDAADVQIPTLCSDTEVFYVSFGLDGNSVGLPATNCCVFIYDMYNTSGHGSSSTNNWLLITSAGSGVGWSVVDSGVIVGAGAWTRLAILRNYSTAYYFINGTSILTNSTTCPTTGATLNNAIRITKTAGNTSRSLYCDWLYQHTRWATARTFF